MTVPAPTTSSRRTMLAAAASGWMRRAGRFIPLGLASFVLLAAPISCTRGDAPRSPAQLLAFPVPAGWSIFSTAETPALYAPEEEAASGENLRGSTVRLRDKTGACQIEFSRSLSTRPRTAVEHDMREAFEKVGHPTASQPSMSLGGVPATHFSITFPGNVAEQVYLVRSGNWLLTLVTVHAAECKDTFQSTLDDFRA